jgi:protein TonB
MFQQTFVPDVSSGRKPIGIAVSIVVQIVALAVLALLPLLVRQPVPAASLRLLLLGPTPPATTEQPVAKTSSVAQPNVPRVRSFRLTAPLAIPKQISTVAESAPPAPDIGEATALTAAGDSLLSGFGATSSSIAPPKPRAEPEVKRQIGPLAVGGNVAAANLVHRVEPAYPPIAKAARIQGVVVFQAVIGADGQIRNLQLGEGHPLLVEAAKTAILQWRYRPTLLNGKPVEVLTTITVRFALSQ